MPHDRQKADRRLAIEFMFIIMAIVAFVLLPMLSSAGIAWMCRARLGDLRVLEATILEMEMPAGNYGAGRGPKSYFRQLRADLQYIDNDTLKTAVVRMGSRERISYFSEHRKGDTVPAWISGGEICLIKPEPPGYLEYYKILWIPVGLVSFFGWIITVEVVGRRQEKVKR